MICPVCKTDMIVVERNKIELDYCAVCRGAWFDTGELELLLAGLGVEKCADFLGNVLKDVETSRERSRRCPACAVRMKKVHIGEQPRVLIDACKRGDGLWFDGGELDSLLTQLKEHPATGPECDRRIEAFLKDTLQAKASKP